MFERYAALLPLWAWLVLSMGFYAVAEVTSKFFAQRPCWLWFLLTPALFTSSTLFGWLPGLLKCNQLAWLGILYAVLASLITLTIGLFVFCEQVHAAQLIGALLAIVSVFLLAM